MGTRLQLLKDTDTGLDAYTPAAGEIVVSTDDGRPRSGDGSTAGGIPLALKSEVELGSWVSPTLLLGWIGLGGGYQDPRYRIDGRGMVTIDGAMQRAGSSVDGVIWTMPAGYRPAARQYFACYSAGGLFRVDIYANGDVETSSANMSGSSFGGIQYYID